MYRPTGVEVALRMQELHREAENRRIATKARHAPTRRDEQLPGTPGLRLALGR